MYKLLICVLISVFAVSQSLVGRTCTQESECDAGECCQILSAFMVVSKRQAQAISLLNPTTGTCQKYKLEGDNCSSFEKINGYCSCEPGTTCHMYEVPINATTVQAKMMVAARPGYQWMSKCERPAA